MDTMPVGPGKIAIAISYLTLINYVDASLLKNFIVWHFLRVVQARTWAYFKDLYPVYAEYFTTFSCGWKNTTFMKKLT